MGYAEEFSRLLREGLEWERCGKTADATDCYVKAMAAIPGHALPFTRLSVLTARANWGFPPPTRPPIPPLAGRVTMSSLGQNGRFGNQILQYGYLRLYAEACECGVETGDWIGRDLFGIDDPLISRQLPRCDELGFDAARAIAPGNRPRQNVDLSGYFGFHTGGYAHAKARFRDLFRLKGRAGGEFDCAWTSIAEAGKTIIALHIRRGDFGYGRFWIAPLRWYQEWLEANWASWREPVLYVATDDPSVLTSFARYRPLDASIGNFPNHLQYVLDFCVLASADVAAIANSTFSFVAAMLNERGNAFFRPNCAAQKLQEFDPWDSVPLLDPPWIKSRGVVTPEEIDIISRFIGRDSTVLDAGANRGEWSRAVQERLLGRVRLFAFEPNPIAFASLAAWAETTRPGSATVLQAALAAHQGRRKFRLYEWQDELSGFYVRNDTIFASQARPKEIEVDCIAVDEFCQKQGVRHIHFLKIDVEGAEAELLDGCRRMLSHARIDCLQFEYGGTFRDSNTRLRDIFHLLKSYSYRLFKIGTQLRYVSEWSDELEDFRYANYLAIHQRLTPYIGIGERKLPDIASIAVRYGVPVTGAIHIGAHLGEELGIYRSMGIRRVILVEANPDVFTKLRAKIGKAEDVVLVNRAIAATNGVGRLHVTSSSQSSSLLALREHSEIYPTITEQQEIEVQCVRLDDLWAEINEDRRAYSFLNIDVQGAELMVLQGAEETLEAIDLINIEVCFTELYAGCAQIDEIDEFLLSQGFGRVDLACPYHPTWGDAVYVRTRYQQKQVGNLWVSAGTMG